MANPIKTIAILIVAALFGYFVYNLVPSFLKSVTPIMQIGVAIIVAAAAYVSLYFMTKGNG